MIKYVEKDILEMKVDLIAHQVNTQGIMGGGLAKSIREKYTGVYSGYKGVCDLHDEDLLGNILITKATDNITIINLFAQEYAGGPGRLTDYDSLRESLTRTYNLMKAQNLKSIALPFNLGCGLAKGSWEVVEKIIEDIFKEDPKITCYICKLPNQ